jgi:hypothetical protein
MCTDKHLGIDTAQVVQQCKAIIKMCEEQPHAVDSELESCYCELVRVSMMMKQSYNRAKLEIEANVVKLNKRAHTRLEIPDLAVKYPIGLTSARIKRMLDAMTPEEVEALIDRVQAQRT